MPNIPRLPSFAADLHNMTLLLEMYPIELRQSRVFTIHIFLLIYRCNNVLYIKGVDEEDEDGEMKE